MSRPALDTRGLALPIHDIESLARTVEMLVTLYDDPVDPTVVTTPGAAEAYLAGGRAGRAAAYADIAARPRELIAGEPA